jgi:glycosyltransferase involved in cell wall biosynthesis
MSNKVGPRVVFVNRYFHPDHSATSQILSDLAFFLADRGLDVNVVTSRLRYDDPAATLPATEDIRGVHVHRVWTSRFGRSRLLGRAVDYLTFYLSATASLLYRSHAHTILVAKTDPPLMSVPSAWVSRLRRATLVNWTQDLFPEIALGLSVPGLSIAAPALRWLRNRSLAVARANVVLGTSMAAKLKGQGIDDDKVVAIPNWGLAEVEREATPAEVQALRDDWGLSGKLVVGYSGNFGRAHDFATILAAAVELRHRDDLAFLLIGGGAQRAWVEEHVRAQGLTNVVLKPYQPLDRLHVSLALPDLHLISLKPHLEGLLSPSKLYAVLAAGRAVLFVGDVQGEIARLVRESDCGQAFADGDGAALAKAIAALAADPAKVQAMGRRARDLWDQRYRRASALAAWEGLLARVADPSS